MSNRQPNTDQGIDAAFAGKKRQAEEQREQRIVEAAHQKAESAVDEDRIDPRNFVHYDKAQIKKDLDEVASLKERFRAQATPGE